jgi:hypothetical protein
MRNIFLYNFSMEVYWISGAVFYYVVHSVDPINEVSFEAVIGSGDGAICFNGDCYSAFHGFFLKEYAPCEQGDLKFLIRVG